MTKAIQVSSADKPREERALLQIERELNPGKITVIGADTKKDAKGLVDTGYEHKLLWECGSSRHKLSPHPANKKTKVSG
ncbi:MAG: hypothetical protein WC408_02460 [Candidatus Micrarchaeia archaeon]|jgi:hypothetical protein